MKRGPWWKRRLGALDLTARQWRIINATMRMIGAMVADGTLAAPTAFYRTTKGTCDVCCMQVEGTCDCARKPTIIISVNAPDGRSWLIWLARNGARSWDMTKFDLAASVWGLVKVYQFNDHDALNASL
jgi:hypothetical protein